MMKKLFQVCRELITRRFNVDNVMAIVSYLFVIFWLGFVGGIIAQQISADFAIYLGGLMIAIWICAFVFVRLVSAFFLDVPKGDSDV